MSTAAASDLHFLLSIINKILGLIRQDFNPGSTKRQRQFNFFIPWIVILSSVYVTYLLNCLAQMKNLEKISEILWILPLMIQYCFKSVNGELQRDIAMAFVTWMKSVYEEINSVELIAKNVKFANDLCMRIAKFIFGWVLDTVKSGYKRTL